MNRSIAQSRVTNGMQRVGTVLVVATLAAACASSSTPDPSAPQPSSTSSASSTEPIPLDGHIILGRDTFYIGNADGSGLEELADPSTYCCIARISPDRTRILTMPGTDQHRSVRGGRSLSMALTFELLPRPDETLNLVPQTCGPRTARGSPSRAGILQIPSRTGIYTARVDGTDLVRVTNVTRVSRTTRRWLLAGRHADRVLPRRSGGARLSHRPWRVAVGRERRRI